MHSTLNTPNQLPAVWRSCIFRLCSLTTNTQRPAGLFDVTKTQPSTSPCLLLSEVPALTVPLGASATPPGEKKK